MTDSKLTTLTEKKVPAFLVVGISGVTNGGKSTAAEKLKNLFPNANIMSQDAYFMDPEDERLRLLPQLNGHENWESLDAIEMDRLLQDVDKWMTDAMSSKQVGTVPLLIIEGFLIFNHCVLANLFHRKYFIQIDRSTCINRRRFRTYNPPDEPGYFEEVVWPMYLKNKAELSAQHDIVYLDGTKSPDDIVSQIAEDIRWFTDSGCPLVDPISVPCLLSGLDVSH
ncbi:hypothetical protein C0Q70_20381 [Pomacea canaliculata]|uniref:Phosphoribulokinase/uridine kinase domain-containing protein n=1 Tax=Pomacea canaliculata TaxID=400727 RepID=A0A2T7NFD4_POMCA|nr:nicotinamide riboside kinase 1-like isoform X2 [Pomacea canaliculata]PVD19888.1 hypothetical protein C0Q70_20381 [Pomacea canaliculata]